MWESTRIQGNESKVRVSVIQMEPKIGEKEYNINHSVELIRQAVDSGAKLLVLPELCNSGYVFNSREESFAMAEPLDNSQTIEAWKKEAVANNIYIVGGVCEREGDSLYNSSVLIGPNGLIGSFRKMHLWFEEKLFFEPGNLGFPVFKTPIGNIGMCICYDMWFPESFRLLASQGADIVCCPTNWVPIVGQREDEKPMALYLTMAAAHSNCIFIAAADRVGVERDQPFLGHSLIVGPEGWSLSEIGSFENEEIISTDCNLIASRTQKNWNTLNVVMRDRRTDYYEEMLGTNDKPHAF